MMNEDELKKLLQESANVDIDQSHKQQTIAAAVAAYDEEFPQGLADEPRPTEHNVHILRRTNMLNQRFALSGLASAAVVILAVVLVFDFNRFTDINELPADVSTATSATRNMIDSSGRLPLPAAQEQARREVPDAAVEQAVAQAELDAVTRSMQKRTVSEPARLSEQLLNDAAYGGQTSFALKPGSHPETVPATHESVGRDKFEQFETNSIQRVSEQPVSTFSIDVDTSSYSFIRKQLNQGVLPQKAAVRLEEMVNYFPYDYPVPDSRDVPFEASVSVMDSPWRNGNRLVHIGIQGYEIAATEQLRSNIVFLLDVSGSMNQPDKLPLVKQSMNLLLSQLHPEDTVAIVVYAGAAGTVLPPTPVKERQVILGAMNRLSAGGSTAGAAGIRQAYQLAEANYIEGGINRIFLATDGDFNVGITNREELKGFVERKRDSGIYLSVLGFGQGNYQDELMQKLAQNGNGIAAYIDTLSEAQKVLVDEATSMLFPIANDVKLQVEFNPATVSEYRLLGYETRMLKQEDFNNDRVDAGEIGAGHSVTAIYEVTPAGSPGLISESRYGKSAVKESAHTNELGMLNIRYKLPGESSSRLIQQVIPLEGADASTEARFAIAVAGFAQLLKDGKYTGTWNYQDALDLAIANRGTDPYGYRAEFTRLVRAAMTAQAMQ